MVFDTKLLEVKYLYFPNPYVYYNFTNETVIASDGARVVYGATKFFLAIILFVFEIAYLMTLKRRKGYGSNFSFTLLFYIGIADFFQLLAHIASGFMLMTLMSSAEYTYIFGPFLEAGFFITGYMTMALPIHRALHIIFPTTAEKFIRPIILKGILVFYLFFAIISFGYFWNNDAGIAYIPESVYWGFTYNRAKPDLNTYMRIVEEWSVLAPIVVGAFLYALIIFTICYKVGKYKARELRLTAQIFAVLIVCTICYVMWYKFLDAIRTDDQHFKRFLSDMVFVFYNGMNPLIYFLFHKDIRRNMKNLMTFQFAKDPMATESTLVPMTNGAEATSMSAWNPRQRVSVFYNRS